MTHKHSCAHAHNRIYLLLSSPTPLVPLYVSSVFPVTCCARLMFVCLPFREPLHSMIYSFPFLWYPRFIENFFLVRTIILCGLYRTLSYFTAASTT